MSESTHGDNGGPAPAHPMHSPLAMVLHVITSISRGGAENHLFELVRGQIARGYKVTVAYLKGDGYWAIPLQELGVTVAPLGLTTNHDVIPLARLLRLILEIAPDIVHTHLPPAELYTRLALLALRPAPILIISKHNDEPFYRGPGQRHMGAWVQNGPHG